MTKSILIAGKDLPEGNDFADGAVIKERNVAITQSLELKPATSPNIKPLTWLRTSPVSARTLVLDCETAFERLDESVLYFDESYYVAKFNTFTTRECSEAVDEMILSFQYLTLEILSRYEKVWSLNLYPKELPTPKLVFLLKKSITESDVGKKSSLRSLVPMASGPFVAAAAAAFEAFAENTAAIFVAREYVDVVLVRSDLGGNDASKNDRSLSEWLCTYLDDLDSQKKKLSLKCSLLWVNAGSRASGFSLFG